MQQCRESRVSIHKYGKQYRSKKLGTSSLSRKLHKVLFQLSHRLVSGPVSLMFFRIPAEERVIGPRRLFGLPRARKLHVCLFLRVAVVNRSNHEMTIALPYLFTGSSPSCSGLPLETVDTILLMIHNTLNLRLVQTIDDRVFPLGDVHCAEQ